MRQVIMTNHDQRMAMDCVCVGVCLWDPWALGKLLFVLMPSKRCRSEVVVSLKKLFKNWCSWSLCRCGSLITWDVILLLQLPSFRRFTKVWLSPNKIQVRNKIEILDRIIQYLISIEPWLYQILPDTAVAAVPAWIPHKASLSLLYFAMARIAFKAILSEKNRSTKSRSPQVSLRYHEYQISIDIIEPTCKNSARHKNVFETMYIKIGGRLAFFHTQPSSSRFSVLPSMWKKSTFWPPESLMQACSMQLHRDVTVLRWVRSRPRHTTVNLTVLGARYTMQVQ